jgi:hypothetical protein
VWAYLERGEGKVTVHTVARVREGCCCGDADVSVAPCAVPNEPLTLAPIALNAPAIDTNDQASPSLSLPWWLLPSPLTHTQRGRPREAPHQRHAMNLARRRRPGTSAAPRLHRCGRQTVG